MKKIKIKNVEISGNVALAPMAGICDYAFRVMAKHFGVAYVIGEMASSKGICYNDKKSAELLEVTETERPMAVQLFGSEPEYIAQAIKIAERYNPDIIDINAGCPVPKISGNGAGAALMKSPQLVGKIITAAVRTTNIPITLKIRSGWDAYSVNAIEVAKIAENCGASAITVHARTKEQLYSGKADWSIIKAVKSTVSIPVIGNGDVTNAEECVAMYRETGCDLVMVGRAACGRPWIFSEINHYMETNEIPVSPDLEQRLKIMTDHIELLVKSKGEYIGMKEARKHTGWYIKGLKNAASYRVLCGGLSTIDDFYYLREKILYELAR